jgi:tetratricopeptide (TPR) repeat protein
MRLIECHNLTIRFFAQAALCFLLLFLAACGGSKDKHLARGEEYLQKRKFHEALMEFRTAADIDRDSGEAHWGLARAYENLGQFGETIEALRKTGDLSPDNLAAKVKLGNYYLLVQPPMIGDAEKIVDEVGLKDANNVEGRVLKASVLAAQNRPESEIVAILDAAVAIEPNRVETFISKSRYFQKIEKAKLAEETIRAGIAAAPNSAAGYVEYGRFLEYSDRVPESEAQYLKAVAIEPKSVEAREALADHYTSARQIEKAEAVYRELSEIQENSPESRIAFAGFYSRVGRDDEAVKLLSAIISEMPGYVRARYRLSDIHLERRENQKVSEQIVELLRINDQDTEALLLKARLALAEDRAEEAVKDLEDILKKLPSHKDALFFMVESRLALGQTEQARAFIGDLEKYHPNFLKTRLLKIQAAFADGDAEAALRFSNELFRIANGTVSNAPAMAIEIAEIRFRALSARGLANLALGKISEAKTDLAEVQKNAPRSAPALVNLARIAVAERNYEAGLASFEKALELDPLSFDALSGAVAVLTRLGRLEEAHVKIDAAIKAEGDGSEGSAALHYIRSDVFLASRNAEAAESELRRAIEIDESYLPAYSAYASILVDRGRTDEAIAQYKSALARKPSAALHTLLAMLEESRENAAEAEKNYRKALELAPGAPIAANNLAWLIADGGRGNLDEALTLSQAVVNRHSNVPGYYDTLGWVYFKKGLFSPAVEQLRKAVALDEIAARRNGTGTNSAYRFRLATVLAASGDKVAARREIETSLRNVANLSPKEAQDARSLLATL